MTTERALSAALCGLVEEPVVPPALAERVGTAYARRRRRRGAATVAAVACGVATIVVAPSLLRTPRASAPPVASPPARVSASPALKGPYVAASGEVVAERGKPVRFCPPRARAGWSDPGPPVCPEGIRTERVDLDALEGRQEREGTVWGNAWLKGVYRDGTFTVVEQEAPRRATGSSSSLDALRTVPCPEPEGGWATNPPAPPPPGGWGDDGPQFIQPSLAAADRWAKANPGEIVHSRFANPARDRSVVLLVAKDPAKVEAALRDDYPNALCVVPPRYTSEQIRRTREAVRRFMQEHGGVSSGAGFTASADGQPAISLALDVMTPEAERFLAEQPSGLVKVELWLAPAG